MDSKVPFVINFRDTLRDAHQRVRKATERSARTQKLYYDSRSKRLQFQTGQLVWLYWPQLPIRQKFKSFPSFGPVHGKYIILTVLLL